MLTIYDKTKRKYQRLVALINLKAELMEKLSYRQDIEYSSKSIALFLDNYHVKLSNLCDLGLISRVGTRTYKVTALACDLMPYLDHLCHEMKMDYVTYRSFVAFEAVENDESLEIIQSAPFIKGLAKQYSSGKLYLTEDGKNVWRLIQIIFGILEDA